MHNYDAGHFPYITPPTSVSGRPVTATSVHAHLCPSKIWRRPQVHARTLRAPILHGLRLATRELRTPADLPLPRIVLCFPRGRRRESYLRINAIATSREGASRTTARRPLPDRLGCLGRDGAHRAGAMVSLCLGTIARVRNLSNCHRRWERLLGGTVSNSPSREFSR
ncbi:hypothetical protein C8Q77DRAFT_43063 [Trametes polyzona]|nr:hypothetical protein C8Q77DRAFT_43063 [Trametes polyzona]